MDRLHSKICKFAKLHTIPPVLDALIKRLEDDESNPGIIAEIIGQDISLTARVLRVANSAFYKRQLEVKTIDQAVAVLGTRAVKALALSVSLFDVAYSKSSSRLMDLKEFWRHNLEVAVISSLLAEKVSGCQPEEAFACGMLHDLGILFLIQEFPKDYSKVLESKDGDSFLEDTEREIFGMTHSEIGAKIVTTWNLPGIFGDSVANHHRQDLQPIISPEIEIWRIVNLAHRFCRQGIDVVENISSKMIEQRYQMVSDMGIDTDSTCRLLAEVQDRVIKIASFLDIDISDPLTLLTKANSELGKLYELYEKAIVENDKLNAKILEQEKSRIALRALETVLATFSHFINNATTAIIGRAQILDHLLKQQKLSDSEGKIAESVKIISESVDLISAVLEEAKELSEFNTISYYGRSRILDIEKKVKARLGRLA
jgi:putative nucleotidyltransferase with HDIG domain